MTSHHWSRFWTDHASASVGQHDQVQVLRTVERQPIADDRFAEILADIAAKLALTGNEVVLDLACGNGLVARDLAGRCGAVLGVDFCEEFVVQVNALDIPNLAAEVSDITRVRFEDRSFDRVLVYAAHQYLEPVEALQLLESMFAWLRPGGSVLLGDVPDARRMWKFFDNATRRQAYFEALTAGKPIIGTWFDPDWLVHASAQVGFASAAVLSQPPASPNAHYRFDMVLRKSEALP